MIGKTNIPMGMLKGETVSILLKTNQSSNEDLNGVKVVVSYNDESHEYTYNGQFSVAIPNGKTYTVLFGELNGYKTPSSVTYTATQGFSRSVEVTYSSEFLTLNVTGTSTPVVTIKKAKEVGISEKYKVVDYVETNGTQYIDTGFKPNQNTKVVVDFHANDVAKHVWGSRIEWRNNSFLCCWENNFDWCVQINAANFNGGSFDARARHSVEMSCTEFKVDGTTTATYSVDAFQCTNNLLIASVQNSEQSENFVGKYYSFKVYDGNNLVRDYVPVKNSQGVYGLYDRINDTFSPSTGSLTGGGYIYDETIATQTSVSGLHKIAYDTEYMIEASAVDGFTTPEVQYYTANQPSRNVSVDYLLAEERVTVNVSAEDGASVDGQMVKVSKSPSIDDSEEYPITNGKASFSVPYDETYTVSLSDMDGYTTPESQTYTAAQPTREISMEYKKAVEHVIVNVSSDDYTDMDGYKVYVRPNVANGVYIQDVDGNLYTESEWDTTKVANGIAVIADECSFVIALEYVDRDLPWSTSGSSSLTVTTDESAALKDFNGVGNTANMILTEQGSENAAKRCSNYLFPNGQSGYLGAAGEWGIVYNIWMDIVNLLEITGGEAISGGNTIWTSTQYDSAYAWSVNVYVESLSYDTVTDHYDVRAFTEFGSSYTITNGKVEFDVAPGVEYRISVEDVDGYTTPEPQSFVAESGTRTVNMVYKEVKLGVFIQGVSGKLYETDAWGNQETPNGVAVITENCRFVMALESAYSSQVKWASNNYISPNGVTYADSLEEAKLLYDGKANTNATSSLSSSQYPAFYRCRMYSFPNGQKGYLGAAGEWQAVLDNFVDVMSAYNRLDLTFTTSAHWTSTMGDTTARAWYATVTEQPYNRILNSGAKTSSYWVHAFTTI